MANNKHYNWMRRFCWGDWGNNLTLPVSEGGQPYDEAFAL
jgi:hypothetical protein